MSIRRTRWIWAGRLVFLLVTTGLVIYLVRAGLDRADKIASSISIVVALAALVSPYLLPPAGDHSAEDTGTATATGGGRANTGVRTKERDRAARATQTGDAEAHGPGSAANSGVQQETAESD